VAGVLVLLGLVAALITYKASGALATIHRAQATHMLSPRAEAIPIGRLHVSAQPFVRTLNYLAIVWPALVFGVLIGAAVRALIPKAWVGRLFGATWLRSQLVGGLAGAPLMLCSCCVTPVFAAIHERTRQPGSTGALLLASPSLNPAALALTFLLFTPAMATTRLSMAIVLVFGVSAIAARYFGGQEGRPTPCPLELSARPGVAGFFKSFAQETWRLARTTLPIIVVGVLLSSLLISVVPMAKLAEPSLRIAAILVVALVSVPLALPTFAEIPLALGLLAAGAPAGAAMALMIAGPAINLPSLLTISRLTTPRYAAALAAGTFVVAVAGGLLV
jgi:uncharacterized membrane protein YraQ (UPF0718 family)